MNRNDFLNMIKTTGPLNRQDLGEVYELIDIFPYFQSAHLLLLKGLQNNDDVKFENQLRNSAIHIADREVLYYLLQRRQPSVSEPANFKPEDNQNDFTASYTQQTVIESAKNSDLLIDEIEKSEENAPLPSDDETLQSGTNRSILISSEADDTDTSDIVQLFNDEDIEEDESCFLYGSGYFSP